MKIQIGLNTNREISVVLSRIKEVHTSWSFNMFSRSKSGGNACDSIQHALGTVHVQKRDDAQLVQNFRRFESLIGFHRCEQILNNKDARTTHLPGNPWNRPLW